MGLLDEIGGVLTNPELQMLAPMVLGAAGGYMSAPPMSGVGGRIGRGMLGAATGYEKGQEMVQKGKMDTAQLAEIQQHTSNMKLEATKAQNALDDDAQFKQWTDSVIPGMPENDAKQMRAMVASGDKQGAIAFWSNSNQATRDMDGKIISSQFGGDPATIAQLPLNYRQQYRAAAIQAQTQGGEVVQSADGVFMVNKRTGQSTQLKNPDGSPMRPMQPFLKEMQVQGMLERENIVVQQRQQAEQDRQRTQAYSAYLRKQIDLGRRNLSDQKEYDYRVAHSGMDPTDPDDRDAIIKAFGPRPADLPEPMSEDDWAASSSGVAPGLVTPVSPGTSGTTAAPPAAPPGTPAAAGPPGSPPGSPAGAAPAARPGTTPPSTRPSAAPTGATPSPKPPSTPKEPGKTAEPPKKLEAEAAKVHGQILGRASDGKSWRVKMPDGRVVLVPNEMAGG